MAHKSVKFLADDVHNVSYERFSSYFNDRKTDDSSYIFSAKLSKLEREALFNDAENLRLEGKKNESANIYMRCLFSLEVKTAFPSLPRCLRALANFFLEKRQFIKAIHFVQAERLYYESALLDTAALQQKLIDITSGKFCKEEKLTSPITELCKQDLLNSKTRLMEYGHLISYFKYKKDLESAMIYAQKSVKLTIDLFGPDSIQTKDCLCIIQNLADEIALGKTLLVKSKDIEDNLLMTSNNRSDQKISKNYHYSKIFNISRLESNDNDKIDVFDQDINDIVEQNYHSYLGCSASLAAKDLSGETDTITYEPTRTFLTSELNAVYPVLKTIFRFILISLIFIIGTTLVLVLSNHLLLSLRKVLFTEHKWTEDDQQLIMDHHPVSLHTEWLLRPVVQFFKRLWKVITKMRG